MNRIDRLNALRILLESRRLIPAREIATHFGLTLRTVYRDIRSLQDAGIAIEGEAGVGYTLSRHAQMSPVSFESAEALSLLLAGKVVERHLDAYHTKVFEGALRKIRAALPLQEKDHLERLEAKIALPDFGIPRMGILDPEALHPIQASLLQGSMLEIEYFTSSSQTTSVRKVVPIGILFYGGYWHMIAWCEMRKGYRDFRVDRIRKLNDLGARPQMKLKSLDDYLQEAAELFGEGRKSEKALIECEILFSPQVYRLFERTRFRFGFVRQQAIDSGKHLGWSRATFYFDDLDEMARWVLSFTADAFIVSPAKLLNAYTMHVRDLSKLLT